MKCIKKGVEQKRRGTARVQREKKHLTCQYLTSKSFRDSRDIVDGTIQSGQKFKCLYMRKKERRSKFSSTPSITLFSMYVYV